MFGMGMPELLIILILALLLFGAKRVPEIAKSLGKAISAFKQGMKEGEDEHTAGMKSSDETKKNS